MLKIMKTKKYIALIISILVITPACDKGNPVQIRMAGIPWPGYEPLYIASEKKFFKGNIRMLEYPSASEVLRAYKNSNLEVAAFTLDEVIFLHSEGYTGKIVLVLDVSNGSDVLLGQPAIRTARDVKGKKVGVEYTALGAFMLARFLEINHMKPEDVTIVPIELDSHEKYFLSRQIDAVITFDPVKTRLLQKGANIVFDSSMIPGEIVDVLLVRDDIYEKHPEIVEYIKNGWYKAIDYINKDFPAAATAMYPRLKLSEAELKNVFQVLPLGDLEFNKKMLTGKNPQIRGTIDKIYQVMRKNKIVKNDINIDKMY